MLAFAYPAPLVKDKTWTKTKHEPTRHGANGVLPWNGRLHTTKDMTYLFSECILAMSSRANHLFKFFRLSFWSIWSEEELSCVLGSFPTQIGPQWPILSIFSYNSPYFRALLQSSICISVKISKSWCRHPMDCTTGKCLECVSRCSSFIVRL